MFQVLQRAKGKVTISDLFHVQRWRFFLAKTRQEYQRVILSQTWTNPNHASNRLSNEQAWQGHNQIQPHVKKIMENSIDQFHYQPKVSVIMPVYNVDARWLTAAIESVTKQIYPNWELCITDDASDRSETLETLNFFNDHPKMFLVYRQTNGNISVASNTAVEKATGDFLVFLDHDDVLASHALYEIVRYLQQNPDMDIIYSDEDKITVSGQHYDMHFKPQWSPVLLLGYNYVNHLMCIRKSLFDSLGGFRSGFEGAQDYDLLLRAAEITQNIGHIPKILYHWRAIKFSTASRALAKDYVQNSAKKALQEYLHRNQIKATVYRPRSTASYGLPIHQLDGPDNGSSVDIIIPTKNRHDMVKRCINSINKYTSYKNYRILLVDNGSDDPVSIDYFNSLKKSITVIRIENGKEGFSFSKLCNQAVKYSRTDHILFLNNDTEIIDPRWLSRLMVYLHLPNVGAVGARLLFPNRTIQHAGVVLGLADGIAPGHAFRGHIADALSYFFMAETARECSAVTGACLLTFKKYFSSLGGFDEKVFNVSLNDVDYCLKLSQLGYRTVYVPGAELLHHEAISRNKEDDPSELANFRKRYFGLTDRYYNLNLSKENSFSINPQSRLDYIEFFHRPLKVLFFSHNLNFEGATKVIIHLARDLKVTYGIESLITSFQDGPLHSYCKDNDLPCYIQELPGITNILQGWLKEDDLHKSVNITLDLIKNLKPDVVFANVINTFFVIQAAKMIDLPSVWLIHESYDRKMLLKHLPPFALAMFEDSFCTANRVAFVSKATMDLYHEYDQQRNFTVIHNGLNLNDFKSSISVDRDSARRVLTIPDNIKVILNVGTVCERKDQETLIHAIYHLTKHRGDFICYLVGARPGDPYSDSIVRLVRKYKLEQRVKIINESADIVIYYKAADIFAFTSLNESFSLTILEAMAHGLPIATTNCFGVSEQVRYGINALNFGFGDYLTLSSQLEKLIDNDGLRIQMGINSKNMFSYMFNYEEALEEYKSLAEAVWQEGINRTI